jgi:hypothetical protein
MPPVLHAGREVRRAGKACWRSADVITEFRKQAVHHVPAGQAGLPPGETRRDPRQQVLEQASMRVMIYCGISGCCVSVLFHKLA